MKRALLTGGSTFAGSHILEQLLAAQISVRAVVASREETERIQKLYPRLQPSHLDFKILIPEEATVPGAYEECLFDQDTPFDTVIHLTPDPIEVDCLSRYIAQETEALLGLLNDVRQVATRVTKVIIITYLTHFSRWLADSSATRSPIVGRRMPERTSQDDLEYVLATIVASYNIICDSLHRWTLENKAKFDLNTIAAPNIYGPSLYPLENLYNNQGGNGRIWDVCNISTGELTTPFPEDFDLYIDDLANATLEAGLSSDVQNKRFVVSADSMLSSAAIAEVLVARFPDLADRVERGRLPSDEGRRIETALVLQDTQDTASILGIRYRSVEETVIDVAEQMLESQRRRDRRRVIQG
ncbi:NAD(P)-binding protein [Sporormia fimetaria CBS 119925]|uniref:NAD(P)-binding protein n=1 Tax=Sporormia fimetaria CBS 119925 TaxID=1340428 RepID=A0A6A6V9V2_9PLEO|nr:NAD(P)-binding protein [Sporormia fimetaria CBS 119925]